MAPDDVVDNGMPEKVKRRRKINDPTRMYGVSKGSRYREAIGFGNFRYVPDRYHEQSDSWYADLYRQRPETVGQTGQPKRRPRMRAERRMWYDD